MKSRILLLILAILAVIALIEAYFAMQREAPAPAAVSTEQSIIPGTLPPGTLY